MNGTAHDYINDCINDQSGYIYIYVYTIVSWRGIEYYIYAIFSLVYFVWIKWRLIRFVLAIYFMENLPVLLGPRYSRCCNYFVYEQRYNREIRDVFSIKHFINHYVS